MKLAKCALNPIGQIGFYLFFFLTLNLSCKKSATSNSLKTAMVTFTKEGELQLFKKDSLLRTLHVEFAETDYEVQTGLMYRNSMKADQGMLFIFPNVAMHSFYMKNTEFPLDIIFIGEDQKIASFQKNAQALNEEGLSSKVPIKYVLEINAGLCDTWGLVEGDSISYSKN